jgi:hypothetical protein
LSLEGYNKKTALLGGFSVTVLNFNKRHLPNIFHVLIYNKDEANNANKDEAVICKNHPSNLIALKVARSIVVQLVTSHMQNAPRLYTETVRFAQGQAAAVSQMPKRAT